MPSSDESLALVRLDDGRRSTLIPGFFAHPPEGWVPGEPRDEGSVRQGVDVVGSVGPYLFVRDRAWMYGCGAHGFWKQTAHVIDVRDGSEPKVAPDDEEARAAEAEAGARLVKVAKDNELYELCWSEGGPASLPAQRLFGGSSEVRDVTVAARAMAKAPTVDERPIEH